MVRHVELLGGLLDDWADLRVVVLVDSGEDVVGGLVVEGAREDIPEPRVVGIVLGGVDLVLGPVTVDLPLCAMGLVSAVRDPEP